MLTRGGVFSPGERYAVNEPPRRHSNSLIPVAVLRYSEPVFSEEAIAPGGLKQSGVFLPAIRSLAQGRRLTPVPKLILSLFPQV
jgi:hypothetical protein